MFRAKRSIIAQPAPLLISHGLSSNGLPAVTPSPRQTFAQYTPTYMESVSQTRSLQQRKHEGDCEYMLVLRAQIVINHCLY